jgi:hypothetical protein
MGETLLQLIGGPILPAPVASFKPRASAPGSPLVGKTDMSPEVSVLPLLRRDLGQPNRGSTAWHKNGRTVSKLCPPELQEALGDRSDAAVRRIFRLRQAET